MAKPTCEFCQVRKGVPMWNAMLDRLAIVCEVCHTFG